MKRVYLIRHGLPDFPGGVGMCLGTTDIPLGPQGLAQARQMALGLPPVRAVFSSPLTRAVQTAKAICPEVTVLPGLGELDYGVWDGLGFPEIRQRYPELYAARGKDMTLLPPGAEPEDRGLARFSDAMEQAARESSGDVAVVAHAGVIALFLERVTGVRYKPHYCEVMPLFWEERGFYCESSAFTAKF